MRKGLLVALMLATTISMTGCGFNFKISTKGIEYETYGAEGSTKADEKETGKKDKETAAEKEKDKETQEPKETDGEKTSVVREPKKTSEQANEKADSKKQDVKFGNTELGIDDFSLVFPEDLVLFQNNLMQNVAVYQWTNTHDPSANELEISVMKLEGVGAVDSIYKGLVRQLTSAFITIDDTSETEIITDSKGHKWDAVSTVQSTSKGNHEVFCASTTNGDSAYIVVLLYPENSSKYSDIINTVFNSTEFSNENYEYTQRMTEVNNKNPAALNSNKVGQTDIATPKTDKNTQSKDNTTKGGVDFRVPDYFLPNENGSMYLNVTGADSVYYEASTGTGHSEELGIMLITPLTYTATTWDSYESIDDVIAFMDNLYSNTLSSNATKDNYTDKKGNTWKLYSSYQGYTIATAVGQVGEDTLVLEWLAYGDSTEATGKELFSSMETVIDSFSIPN